jgi:hypothetical protein
MSSGPPQSILKFNEPGGIAPPQISKRTAAVLGPTQITKFTQRSGEEVPQQLPVRDTSGVENVLTWVKSTHQCGTVAWQGVSKLYALQVSVLAKGGHDCADTFCIGTQSAAKKTRAAAADLPAITIKLMRWQAGIIFEKLKVIFLSTVVF